MAEKHEGWEGDSYEHSVASKGVKLRDKGKKFYDISSKVAKGTYHGAVKVGSGIKKHTYTNRPYVRAVVQTEKQRLAEHYPGLGRFFENLAVEQSNVEALKRKLEVEQRRKELSEKKMDDIRYANSINNDMLVKYHWLTFTLADKPELYKDPNVTKLANMLLNYNKLVKEQINNIDVPDFDVAATIERKRIDQLMNELQISPEDYVKRLFK